MWELLIAFASALGVQLGGRYLKNRHVRTLAEQILASPGDPTTSIPDALRKAFVVANHQLIAQQVEILQAQHEAGKLRIRAAEVGPKLLDGMDIEVVPRDGSEVFRSPWGKE